MKYIPFIIRKFLDSFRDSTKIVKFYNLRLQNGSFIWLKIFFIKFFYSFSTLRNYKKNSQVLEITEEKDSTINNQIDIIKFIKDINYRGYSEFFNLQKSSIDDFKKLVMESKNHDLQKIPEAIKKDVFKKKNEENKDYFDRIKSLGVSRLTGSLDLNVSNSISSFLLSKKFLTLAKSYLFTEEITVSSSYFISFPNSKLEEKDKISNAQYFHWDNDFTKFLKLYIYLSDVDENSGPHIYVPGTHKNKLFKHQLQRPYSDRDVYNSYPIIKPFLGDIGSSFFVDSYGLHKANVPKTKNRIMLNVHYGKGKILYNKFDKFIKC